MTIRYKCKKYNTQTDRQETFRGTEEKVIKQLGPDIQRQFPAVLSHKMKPLPNDILVIVGTAFSTLWKHHWFCVIQEKSWSSIAVYQMFQHDHNNAINNFKSNHTTTEKWSSIIQLFLPN